MPCCTQAVGRDIKQIKALLFRLIVSLQPQRRNVIGIFLPALAALTCLLVAMSINDPDILMLKAPEQYFVTSTNPSDNQFLNDPQFVTPISLHNCTLFEQFDIGIVRQDSNGNTDGLPVLEAVFEDFAAAYAKENQDTGYRLTKYIYETTADLEDHVKAKQYRYDALCFAFAFHEFEPTQNKFTVDVRMNFGKILPTRRPQTEYEESIANQLYLEEYSNTGFLQTMTSVTQKIISKVYGVDESKFSFQLMYMPMNAGPFYNNLYSEVVGALTTFTVYAFVMLAGRIITDLADVRESRIQQMLQRAGVRKSVDLGLEYFLLLIILPFVLPLLSWLIVENLLLTTSFGFMFVNILIFALRVILQQHLIRFTIDNHVTAEVVEILFEVTQISVTFFAYIEPTIEPTFINWSSFLLPLPFLTNVINLAVIAFNKNMNVELLQSNMIVNGNDLTHVMHISLFALGLKFMIMLYMMPFKIYNDPRSLVGPLYLCDKRFWRNVKDVAHGVSPQVDKTFDQSEQSLLNHDEHPSMGEESVSRSIKDLLTGDERQMIEDGNYENLSSSVCTKDFLQLDQVNVEHGGHHLVHNMSLTVFSGETFVLIGENGAGKSALIKTIAGMQHVHSGKAFAYGQDLFKGFRFSKDNFLALVDSDPILIQMMTPANHIKFCCKLLGDEDPDETAERVLAEFNLTECADILVIKLSMMQKRLLSIAMTIIGKSKVILLDEPTLGMDLGSKRFVWEVISRVKKDRVIIVATQDMQEAKALGDRIGFISHGALKFCGSPSYFANKFDQSIEMTFSLNKKEAAQNESQERDIQELVSNAFKPALKEFTDQQIATAFTNDVGQIVVKLPKQVNYQTLHQYINMDQLYSEQGVLYEQLDVKSTSMAQSFGKMLAEIHHGNNHGHSESPSNDSQSHDLQTSTHNDPVKSVSRITSTFALMREDFSLKVIWKQLLTLFLLCLLAMGQETIWIFFSTGLDQPIINYTNIEETWAFNGLPILTFFNGETSSGQSTSTLMQLYDDAINGRVEQVKLEEMPEGPPEGLSTKETLTQAGEIFFEMFEEAETVRHEEAFASYYIYEFDTSQNSYSIGVFGNQLAAASGPTFGATMLQTLAKQITGQSELKIEFRNNLLPTNISMLPQEKPAIAEIYGVSILAACTVVIIAQVQIFAKPVDEGFMQNFTTSGGSKLSFVFSKYLKALLFNLVLFVVTMGFLEAQRFYSEGFWSIMLIYCFIEPLYVLALSSILIRNGYDWRFVQRYFVYLMGLFFVFALMTSGTAIYSQGQFDQLTFMFYGFFLQPPFVLSVTLQLGFIYDRMQVINGQDQTAVNLAPYQDPDSYYFANFWALIYSLLIYGLMLLSVMRQKNKTKWCFCFNRRTKKALQDQDLEADLNAQDVQDESRRVEQLTKSPTISQVVVVQNLQTFDCFRLEHLSSKQLWKEGTVQREIYLHDDNKIRGMWKTKGISIAFEKSERFVFLDSQLNSSEFLFKAIVGLIRPVAGQIIIDGRNEDDLVKNYRKYSGIFGYQPEQDAIDENLTVLQHMQLFAKLAAVPFEQRDMQVSQMIEACCLSGQENTKAGELTYGLLRRLTLGMALLGSAKVVILSYPLSGVDPASKTKLIKTIKRFTEGRSLIMSTRDADEAELIGSRIGIMLDGKMVAVGSVDEILLNHSQGITIDVQTDSDQLRLLSAQIQGQKQTVVDGHQEAFTLLSQIQAQLDGKQIMVACGNLADEYRSGGKLQALWCQIDDAGVISANDLVQQVLVLNLAQTLVKLMNERRSQASVRVASIQTDLIRLEVVQGGDEMDFGWITLEMQQLTKELMVAYFFIGRTNLERVYSKLVNKGSKNNVGGEDNEKLGENTGMDQDQNVFLKRKRTMLMKGINSSRQNSISDESSLLVGQGNQE